MSAYAPLASLGGPPQGASLARQGPSGKGRGTFRTLREKVIQAGSTALRCRPAWVIVVHLVGFASVYLLSFTLRYEGRVTAEAWEVALGTLPLVMMVKLLAMLILDSHRGWWLHATFADFTTLASVATLGSAVLALATVVNPEILPVPGSLLAIDWAGTLLGLLAARGAGRAVGEIRMALAGHERRVLVVRADEAGEAIVRRLKMAPGLGMRVVGFLDSGGATRGRTLAGLPVLGELGEVGEVCARSRVEEVLVSDRAFPAETLRTLVIDCKAAGVRLRVVPGIEAMLDQPHPIQPRDVAIEDLLGRPPVQLDTAGVGAFLKGRVVVVTGASGSIGSEICRQVLSFGPARLILLDNNENGLFFLERELAPLRSGCELVPCVGSIADAGRIDALFTRYRPEVVFHAAAHKHVPMMEANPGEAVKNNVFGTRTLVEAALRAKVGAFVMISTDKVVNPTSVMGACKRVAEMVVQSYAGLSETRLVTVRFGNVLGSTGSVVPVFREQIRRGESLTLTHPEITRFFMTIPEAAQLVLQAGSLGDGGEIFVLDMGKPVKLLDLARDMIRLSGLEEGRDIGIAFTGLRPGEKLYEELYDPAEAQTATPHPKIFRASPRPCPREPLRASLVRLAAAVDRPAGEVIDAIKELLPEYRPNRPAAESHRVVGLAAERGTGPMGQLVAARKITFVG